MKLLFNILCFTFFNICFSQGVQGSWNWKDSNGKHASEIIFVNVDTNNLQGNYCSIFYNGEKVDCNNSQEEFFIQISNVTTNIYQGTFRSNFSGLTGKLKIIYNPKGDTFLLEILEEPDGEYYLPDGYVFKR